MSKLTYTFEMYNDLTSTKYTVDNKKIEGDASYSPGSSQVISAGEMSTMTVTAGKTTVKEFSGSFEIDVDGKKIFECEFSITKGAPATFNPKDVTSDHPYLMTVEGPTWTETTAEVKFHLKKNQ